MASFLDHWRPDLAVFVESELWPNLLLEAYARGVKLALVSARLTEATAERWTRFPASARRVTSTFDLVMPQDQVSAERLERMGARIDGLAHRRAANETSCPGHRENQAGQSSTIWSRWTIALLGA